ncbi:hypothetical protein scyTo_0007686 [Scyliorhinus torazame]|uniref:Uncharacterized protein n=1 Tax=Scyliorhinus torazame TaxID=75743 RepID=A0A401NWR5_SCYTO|nr:hypothetical protein [Scyliorhinus torazame]
MLLQENGCSSGRKFNNFTRVAKLPRADHHGRGITEAMASGVMCAGVIDHKDTKNCSLLSKWRKKEVKMMRIYYSILQT